MTATDTAGPDGSARSRGDVADVVARTRHAFADGRTRPIEWRHEQLDGLVRMLDRESATLTRALTDDLGKPHLEGWATDIGTTAAEIRHLRKHLASWMRPERVKLPLTSRPGRASVVYEPLGTALVLAPWNYPIQLLLEPMAAAFSAGNTVVAKPSEIAPSTSEALARLVPRYVDPEGVAVVEGDVEVSTALLAESFDHIFFTGSTTVGRVVMQAASRHLTPVVLELGGKSPAIVDDAADIGVAARRIAWGKWLNAGQTCVAPDYVLVSKRHRDELVDAIGRCFDTFADGSTRLSPHYARIVSERHTRRLERLLSDHGGQVAYGGEADIAARYVEPTIIVDADESAAVMQDEIFGPILPVLGVQTTAEAIDFVQSRPKPLALYVFTEDAAVADEVVNSTTSGGVCVNHTLVHVTPSSLPFGGVGSSGMGRYHGRAGFEAFSNAKAVLRKRSRPDPSIIYPPYSRWKQRLIKRFM